MATKRRTANNGGLEAALATIEYFGRRAARAERELADLKKQINEMELGDLEHILTGFEAKAKRPSTKAKK